MNWTKDSNCATNWQATQNVVTIGTMFSGIDSYIHALENIPFQHCFSIEQDEYCCKVLRNTLAPQLLIQQDVMKVNVDLLPHVDLFCASPPCQPYSSLGSQDAADPRCDLITPVINFIVSRKPMAVIVENVVKFKESRAYKMLRRCLLTNHYRVEVNVLDSSDFCSLQKRKRLFLVAHRCGDIHVPWPAPLNAPARPISTILQPLEEIPANAWLTEKGQAYLEKRKDWGAKIFTRDYVGTMPTFCKSMGHQIKWKHCIREADGRLRSITSREIARLMGFSDEFPVNVVSRTQTQYQFGNSIDLYPLRALMSEVVKLLSPTKKATT
jgi:DNA (cytosine-5)-methyltransferase 1